MNLLLEWPAVAPAMMHWPLVNGAMQAVFLVTVLAMVTPLPIGVQDERQLPLAFDHVRSQLTFGDLKSWKGKFGNNVDPVNAIADREQLSTDRSTNHVGNRKDIGRAGPTIPGAVPGGNATDRSKTDEKLVRAVEKLTKSTNNSPKSKVFTEDVVAQKGDLVGLSQPTEITSAEDQSEEMLDVSDISAKTGESRMKNPAETADRNNATNGGLLITDIGNGKLSSKTDVLLHRKVDHDDDSALHRDKPSVHPTAQPNESQDAQLSISDINRELIEKSLKTLENIQNVQQTYTKENVALNSNNGGGGISTHESAEIDDQFKTTSATQPTQFRGSMPTPGGTKQFGEFLKQPLTGPNVDEPPALNTGTRMWDNENIRELSSFERTEGTRKEIRTEETEANRNVTDLRKPAGLNLSRNKSQQHSSKEIVDTAKVNQDPTDKQSLKPDELTPSPSIHSAPAPTDPVPKTTPMTVHGSATSMISIIGQPDPGLEQPVQNRDNLPVYIGQHDFKNIDGLDSMEAKFIEEGDRVDMIDDRLQLEPVRQDTPAKVHLIIEDFVKPNMPITTTVQPVGDENLSLGETILNFLNKVGAAVRCTKRDCKDAYIEYENDKPRTLNDFSTPPRRIRDAYSNVRCPCQS